MATDGKTGKIARAMIARFFVLKHIDNVKQTTVRFFFHSCEQFNCIGYCDQTDIIETCLR